MYKKILVALENSPADETLLPHVEQLAKTLNSELLLVHVAEGWAARHYDELLLKESEEMIRDREYLEKQAEKLRGDRVAVSTYLALGEPSQEILETAAREKCDLIAMTSHGHRFFADLFLGSTIEQVRHHSDIPILIVKWKTAS